MGAHVFPTAKFRLTRERLLHEKLIQKEDFIPAPSCSDQDILRVHTQDYLDKLNQGTLSHQELLTLELPYSKELVQASRICVGGTILAAQLALGEKQRVSVHLGGGFHHAFSDHGEGFCVINDVACAAKFCLEQKNIARIMIVDCDLHQGNGTAAIFHDHPNVFTFSIHQQNNYPAIKPPSDLDIGLDDQAADQEYLETLQKELAQPIKDFRPELIFYIAGADPYLNDQLGGLRLTFAGLAQRDQLVASLAQAAGASFVVVFGGGYARDINDTAQIHYNTVKKTIEVFRQGGKLR
ncbi:histone deacetylase [Candidatus Omnitrophota bacterium]